MIQYLTHDLIGHLIGFQAIVLLILVSNLWLIHRARRHKPLKEYPFVSILVPARNEEQNIRRCIESLLAQDYPSFEVIALDDQSSDDTGRILEKLNEDHPAMKALQGTPPPAGQGGKNWACAQLASSAQGELLLFTDADTCHAPQTLRSIVTALLGEKADLLTGFPRQEMGTWMERLLVSFFSWAALCFTPLVLAYQVRWPTLSIAVGQLLLFRRQAYFAIGGHENLGPSIADDIQLARRIKAAGLRWRVIRISDLVRCRMYRAGRDAFQGFVKNYFAAFDHRLLEYLFIFLWLMILFWEPLAILVLTLAGVGSGVSMGSLWVCVGMSLLLWLIPYLELGFPLGPAILYPLTILANEIVAFSSLWMSLRGKLVWKERTLEKPRWKWL